MVGEGRWAACAAVACLDAVACPELQEVRVKDERKGA